MLWGFVRWELAAIFVIVPATGVGYTVQTVKYVCKRTDYRYIEYIPCCIIIFLYCVDY